MRRPIDSQQYFSFSEEPMCKIVQDWRDGYKGISRELDRVREVLIPVHHDLAALSQDQTRRGRKAIYTTENILRALIVLQREGEDFRGAAVRIAESRFLQDFLRLGSRPAMDFTFLNRCFNAIQPETWKKVNEVLKQSAHKQGKIDPSMVRTDTTVVETTIHRPTDSSLMWDSWRVLSRHLIRAREADRTSCPHRFRSKRVRKLHMYITRYSASKSRQRQRKVKARFRELIRSMGWIIEIAEAFQREHAVSANVDLMAAACEIQRYLPWIRRVCEVAERVQLRGEKVPARERVFSIFEPHTELIMRGKRHKPVEFGHVLQLAQTREKFITYYDAMELKRPDTELGEPVVDDHEEFFGEPMDALAADKGFRATADKMAMLEARVPFVAIPKRLGDWGDELMVLCQKFRAGIEGTISVLKRAYRLLRTPFRGVRHFQSHVGLAVFTHNLAVLTG